MELFLALLVLIVIVLLVVLLLRPITKDATTAEKQDLESLRAEMRESLNQVRGMVQTQMTEFRTEVSGTVSNLRMDVGSRLDGTATTIVQVQTKLAELAEATKQIHDIGKDISSLQDILQPPKLRGGLGEMLLEHLLEQVIPQANYTIQYRFSDGKTVDAMIHLGEVGQRQDVPVDSKFPLETFRRILEEPQEDAKGQRRREFIRNVKQHIDRVAEYIRPDEGTLGFALMYVPAENVYYETIIKSEEAEADLFSYALAKRVVPVSPHSFYAYLAAIALGLKGLAIEQSAKQVIEHLQRLGADFDGIRSDFDTLGRHITNAGHKYNDTLKRLERFGDRLSVLPEHTPLTLSESGQKASGRESEEGSSH